MNSDFERLCKQKTETVCLKIYMRKNNGRFKMEISGAYGVILCLDLGKFTF